MKESSQHFIGDAVSYRAIEHSYHLELMHRKVELQSFAKRIHHHHIYEVQKGCSDNYPHFNFTEWPLGQLHCQWSQSWLSAVFR